MCCCAGITQSGVCLRLAWRLQAGATAVVPETLEPSLQLASAVLSQLNMPPDDVQEAIQEFRRAHMGELQVGPYLSPSHGFACCA